MVIRHGSIISTGVISEGAGKIQPHPLNASINNNTSEALDYSNSHIGLLGSVPNLLLFVFSACGGISTGSKLPVLTAYFPVLA